MPRGYNIIDEAILQNRLWLPDVLRPALWLDANDDSTITIATGVSEWRDKSGNERNFTQGTGGTQPTQTLGGLNGQTVLSFNGSQYLTSISAASVWNFLHNTNGSTVIAVWKAGNVSDPNAVYSLIGNNGALSANIGFYIIYDDRVSSSRNNRVISLISRGVSGQNAVVNITADGAHPADTPTIISQVADPNNGTAANRSFLRINRTLIQNNTDLFAPVATNASFALQIGAAGNNVVPLTGYIAEIIILSSIASNSTRQILEGYLAWKWGLQDNLSQDHPFLNRPPFIGDN
jgi:hypothetical protein